MLKYPELIQINLTNFLFFFFLKDFIFLIYLKQIQTNESKVQTETNRSADRGFSTGLKNWIPIQF